MQAQSNSQSCPVCKYYLVCLLLYRKTCENFLSQDWWRDFLNFSYFTVVEQCSQLLQNSSEADLERRFTFCQVLPIKVWWHFVCWLLCEGIIKVYRLKWMLCMDSVQGSSTDHQRGTNLHLEWPQGIYWWNSLLLNLRATWALCIWYSGGNHIPLIFYRSKWKKKLRPPGGSWSSSVPWKEIMFHCLINPLPSIVPDLEHHISIEQQRSTIYNN